jgi:hypothetical protein
LFTIRRTVNVSFKRLVDPAPLAHDDRAGEYLDALLVAFDDPGVYVDGVAHLELRGFLLQMRLFNEVENSVIHGSLRSASSGFA